jgi:hypothetical protein
MGPCHAASRSTPEPVPRDLRQPLPSQKRPAELPLAKRPPPSGVQPIDLGHECVANDGDDPSHAIGTTSLLGERGPAQEPLDLSLEASMTPAERGDLLKKVRLIAGGKGELELGLRTRLRPSLLADGETDAESEVRYIVEFSGLGRE